MESRKLFSQMSLEEVYLMWDLVNDWGTRTNDIQFAKHSMDRVRQKHITKSEILETVASGKCIEFHIKGDSPRVLLRKQRWNQSYDICCVLDVLTGTIVTAYTNHSNDEHDTLHTEIYDEDLDIGLIMSELYYKKGRR